MTPVTYSLELSVDDGATWQALTPAPVQATTFTWVPPGLTAPRAWLRLTAYERARAEGQDATDAPFAIVHVGATFPGNRLHEQQ